MKCRFRNSEEMIWTIITVFNIFVILNTTAEDPQDEGHFVEEPENVDLSLNPHQPLTLKCIYSQPVKSCSWWKQDKYIRPGDKTGVVYSGNISLGDCSVTVQRPEVGKDTTLWQCTVKTYKYRNVVSRPARLVVQTYPRRHEYDKDAEYSMMYVNSFPTHSQVHLELKTPYETRVRWFVNGELTRGIHETHVDFMDPMKNRVKNTILVDFANKTLPLRMVHASVEYLTNYMTYKKFETLEIYLITDGFNFSIFEESDGKKFKMPMEIVSPQPILYMDDKPITRRWMTVVVEYPTLNEFYFRCEDSASFPSSLLDWNVITFDTEVTSGFEEFNATYQVFAESEIISLMALLKHTHSTITVSCKARNIFLPSFSENMKTVLIDTTYVAPKCAERNAAAAASSAGAKSLHVGHRMPSLVPCLLPFIIWKLKTRST